MKLTRTLGLTSPHMKGNDVRHAQTVLAGDNIFKSHYLHDPVDGEYGLLTAQAAKRAKYWLGYAEKDLVGVYGQKIENYLTGATSLTLAMKVRRAARLKALKNQPVTLRSKVVTRSAQDVGKKEQPPNSNEMPGVTDWYGMVGPWCAMQVTRWYVDCGSTAFVRHQRYSYVPTMLADARAGVNGLQLTTNPEAGDVVTYDWDNDGVADHTGIFLHWIDRTAGTFKAREGNTSVGNDSNGGEVMDRDRYTSNVAAFIRVTK